MAFVVSLDIELHIEPTVRDAINPEDLKAALWRHVAGDAGEEGPEIRMVNKTALINRLPMRSLYTDRNGVRYWIVTERGQGELPTVVILETSK